MRRSVIAALLILAMTPLVRAQQNEIDISAKILALERIGKMQASELKDLKMLHAILHENFVAVDEDGRLFDKNEMMEYEQTLTSLRYVSKNMSVRLHGSTAVVTGSCQKQGTAKGKAFVRRDLFIDTWLEENGTWVLIASVSTPQL